MFLNFCFAFSVFLICSYAVKHSNKFKQEEKASVRSSEYDISQEKLDITSSEKNDLSTKFISGKMSENESQTESIAEESSNEAQMLLGYEPAYDSAEPLSEEIASMKEPNLQWSQGYVPYLIDNESYDNIIVERILKAMDVIQSSCCVIFRSLIRNPKNGILGSDRQTWLHFTNPHKVRDCVHGARVGKLGEAVITLGFDCMKDRDIIHALLHGLGFKDEITHPQRDTYVRVLWQNIQPKYRHLFRIQDSLPGQKTLVEYDTMSIMHFHDRAYSINGAATISPLIPGLIISPSDNLSPLDKMKLGLAYGQECNKRNVESLLKSCKNALKTSRSEEVSTSSNEEPKFIKLPGKIMCENIIANASSEKDIDDTDSDHTQVVIQGILKIIFE